MGKKEKSGKERRGKGIPGKSWAALIISFLILIYLIFGTNNNLKLLIGGLFLLGQGIYFNKGNKFVGFLEFILGVVAFSVIWLPKKPSWYLLLIYFTFSLVLGGLFYSHRKMRLSQRNKKVKTIYHLTSILLFLVIGIFVMVMVGSVMNFGFQGNLPLTDYLFVIMIVFISIITFFLLFDNFILLLPPEFRDNLIGKKYSASHSFFLSLCLTILIGGFFYINSTNNPILQKTLIVLGLAFFTSLVISDTLKNFFK